MHTNTTSTQARKYASTLTCKAHRLASTPNTRFRRLFYLIELSFQSENNVEKSESVLKTQRAKGKKIDSDGTAQYSFDSPQVKWDLISSAINILYKFFHEQRNDVRLRVLRTEKHQETLGKSQIWLETEPSAQSRNQNLVITSKNFTTTGIKISWSRPILLDFFTLPY